MWEIEGKIEEIQAWIAVTVGKIDDQDVRSALRSLDYRCDDVLAKLPATETKDDYCSLYRIGLCPECEEREANETA